MKRKFILRLLLFVMLPLTITELLLRILPAGNEYYISRVNPFYAITDTTQEYYYFVGSSHVAAAIVPEVLNDHFMEENIQVVNAGRGSSSSTVFYYALLKLAERGLLDHSKVFIEAPGGISAYSDNKNDEWVNSDNVHLMIPFLDWPLFIEFWKYSGNKISTKLELSANFLLYTSRIWSIFKETYNNNTFIGIFRKISERLLKSMNNHVAQEQNMLNQGGIKNDSISIEAARNLAFTFFKSEAENQRRISQTVWEKSRLNDINRLLTKHDSQLVIFEMPVSSVEGQVYQTDIARYNIEQFHRFLMEQNIKYMNFDLSTFTDSDFPDLWHLSSKKAVEYTAAILGKL